MKKKTQQDFRFHAQREYPKECCGVVAIINGKERYFPCTNKAIKSTEHFVLDHRELADVEDLGEVIAICHSHVNIRPLPSEADLVQCEASQLQWHIVHVSIPDGGKEPLATDIHSFKPTGYEAPLVGRSFSHGVLDCFTLLRDYYARELHIQLPNFERQDDWWLRGQNLYMDNFRKAGFEPITDAPQVGDVILMQIRSPVPNHAAVYIGDGQIIHHVSGRMSSRDVYDGYWQENTRIIIRYKGDRNE